MTLIHIFGALKNPLLYRKIVKTIIGPMPNINRTNFAEFFVWPNSWFVLFDLVWDFLNFLFFIEIYSYTTILKKNFSYRIFDVFQIKHNFFGNYKNSVMYNTFNKE